MALFQHEATAESLGNQLAIETDRHDQELSRIDAEVAEREGVIEARLQALEREAVELGRVRDALSR